MEAMGLESLVASAWRLDGYLTAIRHPIKVGRGYSDLDVVAVRWDGCVRIAECKARGGARRVFVDRVARDRLTLWSQAIEGVALLLNDPPAWFPDRAHIKEIEFYLVANIWLSEERLRKEEEDKLTRTLQDKLPDDLRGACRGFVRPSVDFLVEIVSQLRAAIVDEGRGKRYGDPLLDVVRELIRYLHPLPQGGGRAEEIRAEVLRSLLKALFKDESGCAKAG